MQSVKNSPYYSTHRVNVTAADGAPSTSRNEGTNFQGYDLGFFQVIPSGGANPSIELMEWSEDAGTFISANPKFERTGLGADVPYSFTSEVAGRVFWVRVTALGAGSVTIVASGRVTGAV